MWFKPSSYENSYANILTITTNYSSTSWTYWYASGHRIQIMQIYKKILIRMTNTFTPYYKEYEMALSDVSSIHHFALTVTYVTTSRSRKYYDILWYLDGANDESWYDYSAGVVDFIPSHQMYLLSEPSGGTATWQGSLYLLGLYNRSLTDSEVLSNCKAGFSNTPPEAFNVTVSIYKNGVVGTHYDNPGYYRVPVPVLELPTIALQAKDLDEDIASPSYNASEKRYTLVYVTSLPSLATLYFKNGTEIKKVPTKIKKINGNYTIRIRPKWRVVSSPETSPLTSFKFLVVDGVTKVKGNEASISVIVLSQTESPSAINSTSLAYAGRITILKVSGYDYKGDAVSNAYISTPASHGKLYQVYRNGSVSNILIRNATGPWQTRVKLFSMKVAYVYTGSQAFSPNNTGNLTGDSFSFKVADSNDRLSLDGVVRLSIIPSIVAQASSSLSNTALYKATESSPSKVYLFAKDYHSYVQRDLYFKILSVPQHGILKDSATGKVLGAGDVLSTPATAPYTNGVSVLYLSDKYYFNSPSKAWDGSPLDGSADSFYFQAQEGVNVSVRSYPVSQEVVVLNLNNPTFINFSQPSYSIYAIGASSKDTTLLDYAIVRGVNLTDYDLNVDLVRVTIQATYGMVTLNQAHINDIDFNSQKYCFVTGTGWSCKGTGYNDRYMSFVAAPRNASAVLEGMRYSCRKPNVVDELTITIFDGQGEGQCLKESQFTTYSNRSSGCLISTATLTVEVKESAIYDSVLVKSRSSKSVPNSLYLAIYCVIGFLCCASVTWCIRKACNDRNRMKRFGAKNKRDKVDPNASFDFNDDSISLSKDPSRAFELTMDGGDVYDVTPPMSPGVHNPMSYAASRPSPEPSRRKSAVYDLNSSGTARPREPSPGRVRKEERPWLEDEAGSSKIPSSSSRTDLPSLDESSAPKKVRPLALTLREDGNDFSTRNPVYQDSADHRAASVGQGQERMDVYGESKSAQKEEDIRENSSPPSPTVARGSRPPTPGTPSPRGFRSVMDTTFFQTLSPPSDGEGSRI